MPRFPIIDLLIATTLIAIGIGMLWFLYHNRAALSAGRGPFWEIFLFWFGGGVFVGAGVFTPFKRQWIGAFVAVGVQFLLVLVATVSS
jgi:hypothetical protein